MPFLLASCVGSKYLQQGETILYKQKVKVGRKIQSEKIQNLFSHAPNTRLLGLPITHLVYLRKIGENNYDSAKIAEKKERVNNKYNAKIAQTKSRNKLENLRRKRINKIEKLERKLNEGNQFMRWGEELAVYDSIALENTKNNIKNYLFSIGYFDGEISTTTKTSDELTFVTYLIDEKKPYKIDSIIYQIPDKKVESLFLSEVESSQIKKEKYNQDNFAAERERVYNQLSNTGYYNFKRQFIQYEVDSTTLGDRKLIVRQTITNPPNRAPHKQFRLDSIVFSNQIARNKGDVRQTKVYDNKTFNFGNDKYPERLLSWRIFLDKDSLYSKQNTLETQKQLSYLDIFKFVNINYDSSGGQFVTNIFTSPLKKFESSTEFGLSVLDQAQSLPGPFFNFGAKSRNVFGGLEIFQLSANTSIQGITSVSDDDNFYTRFQYGGELASTFPQFLFPLKESARSKIGHFNPRTKFSTGINFEDRRDEYQRTTFNGAMSYIWQVRDNAQYTMTPFDLSYIRSDKTSSFETDLIESGNQSLISAFNSSIVGFTSFNARFNRNSYGLGSTTSRLILTYIETGGNYLKVFGDQPFGINIDELATFNYSKFGVDLRKVNIVNSKSSFAYRFNVGAALAYGQNPALPYEKYFFAGGSNSIRAWQPRRLGPGSFAVYESTSDNSSISIDNAIERPGDIILESSVEYRHDLVGFIDYALFVDAGNIWLWRSETIDPKDDGFGTGSNDDGVFDINTFASEIALGAGYGLRFDFSFLVLRIDIAYKIIHPGYPKNQRFILGDYEFNDLWDFQDKGAINIGIGYPF
ncbi:MAG: BamA/TamA family outer membrane protein [Cyclobacteriaceae bacterium]